MKLLLCIGMLCLLNTAMSQEDKTITVNTLHGATGELEGSVYKYPSFKDGKIVFKDSAFAEAKMNYSRMPGQMLFIRPKGDTLAMAHPELVDRVIIENDTFYYFKDGFLEQVTHEQKPNNLFLKQTINLIGSEKKGAYGTYSPTTAVSSNSTFTSDDQSTQYITIDENKLYKFKNEYYLSDRFRNFFPATKNGFYTIFSTHENELREFIKAHKLNFNKLSDLMSLLAYINSLK